MGTLILSLISSAFFLWVVRVTTISDEDAKNMGCTLKGKLAGCKFYVNPVNEEGWEVYGGNLISDQFIPVMIEMMVKANGGEFTMDMEEIK